MVPCTTLRCIVRGDSGCHIQTASQARLLSVFFSICLPTGVLSPILDSFGDNLTLTWTTSFSAPCLLTLFTLPDFNRCSLQLTHRHTTYLLALHS
ncbi:hypothetical protein BDP55DRAFT_242335 [Colletotrichum godetiae]|uniref:Uncharacterized protein n=1 Tax=Colletotrichum godetiae TaxID=1209918 RepID=A0AAJ0AG68_9PEZI|nr:uncharacterized protein BDP55DRAFT_242335 [Colletotrichum godetiae]KAK1672644.1 hypothetical protein BDP55DRAFT_242335 [Colletotrichum godetiae]